MVNVLPTVADVDDAYATLRDWVIATPVLDCEPLSERAGTRLLLKAECLQHGGSFKIRGALNRLLKLTQAERAAGVVAFSSGNHATAVALAAKWLGIRATIVMPADAPQVKQQSVRDCGAEIVLYDGEREDREAIATRIAGERGAALVPPFDHPHVIAGQGTVGLELAQHAQIRHVTLDALYVPCSGGGLVAGCALAVKRTFPACAVYAVEPESCADTALSLAAGSRRVVAESGRTICDGLRAPTPGAITFALNRRLLAGVVTVTDDEVRAAMALAARYAKLVVEPSGAAGLAAALKDSRQERRRVGVVLSGGNVDLEMLAEVLHSGVAA